MVDLINSPNTPDAAIAARPHEVGANSVSMRLGIDPKSDPTNFIYFFNKQFGDEAIKVYEGYPDLR
jgi:hypothetical protein